MIDPVAEPTKASWLYRSLRPIAVPVFKAAFRVHVEGKEHVPKKGAVILAGVHRSYLDIPIIGLLTWRPLHFMAKAELWDRPFSRWFCTSMGSFPVKRGEPDRSALENSLRVLEGGGLLGLFPEGTRQTGPVVQPCHGGVAWLAQRASAPVVPVAFAGTDEAMGLGASYPKPKRIWVRAGPPIDLSVESGGHAGRRERDKATALLRSELQSLYDGLRADFAEAGEAG